MLLLKNFYINFWNNIKRFFNIFILKILKNLFIFIFSSYIPFDLNFLLNYIDNIENDWLKYKTYFFLLFSTTLIIYVIFNNGIEGPSEISEIPNIKPILSKHW
jgi:hypothetical protein